MTGVSLNRALSKLGMASRSEATELIRAGRVTIDGRVVRDPLMKVVPERIRIAIDDQRSSRAAWTTIVLNKPRRVLTTRRDPEGRRTVYDLLPDDLRHLVPVGRLDFATTGLLILTTDTQLANWLTDPANEVPRRYSVTVRGSVDPETAARMEQGIEAGGERLAASRVTVRKRSQRETHLIVELTEGKNREIRRLFKAAGHEVTKLSRVAFGPLTLGDLQPGEWRRLSPQDLKSWVPKGTCGFDSHPRHQYNPID